MHGMPILTKACCCDFVCRVKTTSLNYRVHSYQESALSTVNPRWVAAGAEQRGSPPPIGQLCRQWRVLTEGLGSVTGCCWAAALLRSHSNTRLECQLIMQLLCLLLLSVAGALHH